MEHSIPVTISEFVGRTTDLDTSRGEEDVHLLVGLCQAWDYSTDRALTREVGTDDLSFAAELLNFVTRLSVRLVSLWESAISKLAVIDTKLDVVLPG